MGLIISRFRKKKTAEQKLQCLQKEIEEIEHNLHHSFQRQKVIVGKFLLYSTILYLIIAAISYFYYYPSTWKGRFLMCVPLLGIPLLIFYAKQFVTWIYKRDISRSKDKLSDLLSRKKLILEDVMNTETYKKAKEILDKFAPEQTKKPTVLQTPINQSRTPQQAKEPQPGSQPTGPRPLPGGPQSLSRRTPSPLRSPMLLQRPPQSFQPPKLIGAVFPPDRGIFDKLVEGLLGDGPNNRYALICRNCAGHNGMVLPEEFEYLAYRCVHCGFPHPARKVRPRLSISSARRPLFPGDPNNSALPALETDSANSSDNESGVKIVEVTDEPKIEEPPVDGENAGESDRTEGATEIASKDGGINGDSDAIPTQNESTSPVDSENTQDVDNADR
ncbi:Predicted integral membrane metal-Hypothetical protein protein (DUF2296) [Nesidiocoris tenuis]|uniref:Endoplasmic reticulum junction formation protein lunapark n=1 Tax=Nesidiocoris tenuis TaxID=355587 RepID=A0ABN7B1E8_9HEMI|nr:Predicted integral membrane metal-Hypothetical protein protein (DUF2296) [Nesidiocoris tenuis]